MSDAREVMTQALQEARGCHRHPLLPWEEHWSAVADEVLAALAAAGLAVVPVDPTNTMISAGMTAAYAHFSPLETYRAMLAAAPKP